jgi:hypothetical protein
MEVIIREFTENDIQVMLVIWNEVVDVGIVFSRRRN